MLRGPNPLPLGPLAILALSVTASAAFAFRMTRAGRRFYALGGNKDACVAAGAPVAGARITSHALCGLCADLGGFALTLYHPQGTHTEGVDLELDAITAAVIGGTLLNGGRGNPWGTLLGTLVIGLITICVTTYEHHQMTLGSMISLFAGLLLTFVLLKRMMAHNRTRSSIGQ